LFDRCQLPDTLTANPTHGLTSWHACTTQDKLQEGFRSFPSGHSSFAWTGMWFLVLYLGAKFRIANRRGYTIKSWLLLAPISCAALVSISRTMDYRHHATDVIAGAVVGVLAGWWGYRQYYPALWTPKSWRPYPPRIDQEDATLPQHLTDASVTDETPLHPIPTAQTSYARRTESSDDSPAYHTQPVVYPPPTTRI
jgi:diacylglycerol diphosphate phosphatase/phosphatidate phosphatase